MCHTAALLVNTKKNIKTLPKFIVHFKFILEVSNSHRKKYAFAHLFPIHVYLKKI